VLKRKQRGTRQIQAAREIAMNADNTRSRGSMLVLVLFLAGLLGVFSAVAAMAMRAAVNSSRSFAENLRAEEAVRAAIEQTVAQSGGVIADMRGTNLVMLDQTQVAVTLLGEAARIDLNFASPKLIAGIFRQIGVPGDQADAFAARVVDWRDDDDQVEKGGAERAAYRALGRVDGPRNGPFVHVAELALVLGIPAPVAAAAAPYLTVASGHEQINPMLADPPVLLALPGASVNGVRDFLARRSNPTASFETSISSLGPVEDFVSADPGAAIRFEARVRLGPNNERRLEAVVYILEGDSEPFRILAWDANPPERIRTLP
jgi:general secretion pathway protein K